jgi:CheY-like chemotaxis protein
MLCELLGILGHAATGVPSAEAALQAARAQDFDLLLTDIGLPGMSGTDLARRLKRDRPALRVVVASGYSAPDGVDFEAAILPKPYDLAQLEQVLTGLG